MQEIIDLFLPLSDSKYGDFTVKLTPGLKREKVIGVRVPQIRQIAKKIAGTMIVSSFLSELPHFYYEENILHSILITECKTFNECVSLIECFMPYIDNWAVCDIITPKVFRKNKETLICKIKEWILSEETYTCRLGIKFLMNFFLDAEFKEEYLSYPSKIDRDDYYVNMMIAWFYATALAKQYNSTLPYLVNNILPIWVHNKAIQKGVESFRLDSQQKEYIKRLKRSR